MSNKQSFTPFYEVASRSINNPARDAVTAEAERREAEYIDGLMQRISELTPEEDARLAEWQAAQLEKDAWMLGNNEGAANG